MDMTQWPDIIAFAMKHTLKQKSRQAYKNKQTKKQVFVK